MANELLLNLSMIYADSDGLENFLTLVDAQASSTGKKTLRAQQTIGTSEEAIVLGEISGSLGWSFFVNLDVTNYLELRVATGSTKFATLYPGMPAFLFIGTGITAPFAIANTASCKMDYLLVST